MATVAQYMQAWIDKVGPSVGQGRGRGKDEKREGGGKWKGKGNGGEAGSFNLTVIFKSVPMLAALAIW